jgi:hypothetical protein
MKRTEVLVSDLRVRPRARGSSSDSAAQQCGRGPAPSTTPPCRRGASPCWARPAHPLSLTFAAPAPPNQPYSSSNEALASALVRIEAELAAVKRMLEDCAAKGTISAFMQVRPRTRAARRLRSCVPRSQARAACCFGWVPDAGRSRAEALGALGFRSSWTPPPVPSEPCPPPFCRRGSRGW